MRTDHNKSLRRWAVLESGSQTNVEAAQQRHSERQSHLLQGQKPRGTPRLRELFQSPQYLLCLSAIIGLLISGCAKSVTFQDLPVHGRAESIAKAVRITDISAAAAGSFLIALYDSHQISESTYRQYTDIIGPAVQAALDESREALKAYIATQSMSAYDKLQTAFGKLAEAAERLTELARKHGWGS